MASRDVQPAKSKHSVSFSEVPLEYRDDPDRRVDTESVVVVSNLPKHADENFIRTVTLGCGEITKVLTSDLGANVGAQISFKNNDGTVKACNQLNQTVINNDRLNACIMNIPSSHKQGPSTPAQTRSKHHNRVGSAQTPSNKSQCRLRGVTPIRTCAAPNSHQNSPARSEYRQPPVYRRVVHGSPANSLASARTPASHHREMFVLPESDINPVRRQPQMYETPRNGYTPAVQEQPDRMAIRNTPANAYVSAEMPEFLINPHHRRRTVGSDIPKCIRYNGKTKLSTFFLMYDRYACSCGWSPQEKTDNLIWCFEGIAADFYAKLLRRNPTISYANVVAKFENRFEFSELVGTSIVQFNAATQDGQESLEQWADRMVDLAEKAYRNLPDEYIQEQSVIKFCSGLRNRDLAKMVTYHQPKSMEDAVNRAKWIRYSDQTIDVERRKEKVVRQVSETTPKTAARTTESSNLEETVKLLAKQLKEQQDALNKVLKSMNEKKENKVVQNKNVNERVCFRCGSSDHFIRNCPKNHLN